MSGWESMDSKSAGSRSSPELVSLRFYIYIYMYMLDMYTCTWRVHTYMSYMYVSSTVFGSRSLKNWVLGPSGTVVSLRRLQPEGPVQVPDN